MGKSLKIYCKNLQASIFGMYHYLVVLYKYCSNYELYSQKGPRQGAYQFYIVI